MASDSSCMWRQIYILVLKSTLLSIFVHFHSEFLHLLFPLRSSTLLVQILLRSSLRTFVIYQNKNGSRMFWKYSADVRCFLKMFWGWSKNVLRRVFVCSSDDLGMFRKCSKYVLQSRILCQFSMNNPRLFWCYSKNVLRTILRSSEGVPRVFWLSIITTTAPPISSITLRCHCLCHCYSLLPLSSATFPLEWCLGELFSGCV